MTIILYATVRPSSEPQKRNIAQKGTFNTLAWNLIKIHETSLRVSDFAQILLPVFQWKQQNHVTISPSHLSGLVWSGLLGGLRSVTVNAKDGRVEASSIHSTIASQRWIVGCWSENCWDLYPQTWRYEILIEGSEKNTCSFARGLMIWVKTSPVNGDKKQVTSGKGILLVRLESISTRICMYINKYNIYIYIINR